jgi:hypothetical protein
MSSSFYEKDGEEYLLVLKRLYPSRGKDRDILWRGKEVAIGFTYDPDRDQGIKFTMHKHGSPESVQGWAEKTRARIKKAEDNGIQLGPWAQPHVMMTAHWELEDLNRILSTTGYLEAVVEKYEIDLSI